MNIKKIRFNKKTGKPKTLVVELSIEEAGYLAKLTGSQSHFSAEQFIRVYTDENGTVYDCLVGEVFNRYWEDGVDDWNRGADTR